MKELLKYLSDYKKESVLGPLFKLLEASFELLVPLVVAAIIDKGIAADDYGYIARMCGVLAALAVIGLVCSLTAQFFAAKAAVGFSTKLRRALFARIVSFSHAELDGIGAATLLVCMTSDINQVQAGVNLTLRLFLRSPFVVFGAMIMAFTIDVRCALIFTVAIPALAAVVFGIMLITMPLYKRVQKQLDSVLITTRENVTGARVIRAFANEKRETELFSNKNERLVKTQTLVGRISALMNPVTYVMINAAVIWLIYRGAIQVSIGTLSQGMVVALYNYMSQILTELVKLANMIISITKAAACANRISEVLKTEPELKSGSVTAGDKDAPAVEFENVCMTYNHASAPALEGVSFTAERGDIIGIIGGTGAGKSSLVNLIPRFYDVSGGAVKVSGVDVRDYDIETLRSKIGIVPQKAVLFKGSIKSNLEWSGGPEAAFELALDAAQARDIIDAKPGGINAEVDMGGTNFSGGQRQRLTIARALAREPEILILDDSVSALDYATDAALREAISTLPYHPTVFIVSQRTASIMHADKIIVLDDGAVAGIGTHRELLESCEVYREIYHSQADGVDN